MEIQPIHQFDIVKWANDLVYIPTKYGPKKLTLWDYQEEILRECTKQIRVNSKIKNKYGTVCFSMPKRDGKTFLAGLMLAHKLTTSFNVHGVVASNSKDQASSVVFDQFKEIIQNSPALLAVVGNDNILDKEVRIPNRQSRVAVISSSKASAWGYGIDIGIVDEIHAAPDDEGLYQILASQTGDRDGMVVLPSQVSSKHNILFKLYEISQAGTDPTLYFKYVCDRNLSPLITDEWLRSREEQLTPLQFDLYHRNLWLSSSRNLFTPESIGECLNLGVDLTIPISLDKLYKLATKLSSSYKIGGGLDRAYPWSKHADRTFWTTVAKFYYNHQEHYLILNQAHIPTSDGRDIRKVIAEDHRRYRFSKILLEQYQAADLNQWALDLGIDSSTTHAQDRSQVPAFTNLYQIVDNHRLIIPDNLPSTVNKNKVKEPYLITEMKDFEQDISHGVPKFGHKAGTLYKDDSVYSLAWAIDSLTEEEAFTQTRMHRGNDSISRERNRYTGN